jgi:hypothetical protein
VGIIFQHAHGSFRSVETGPAFFENLVTRSQRVLESRSIFTLTLRGYLAALNRPGAAVHCESDIWHLHWRRVIWLFFVNRLRRTGLLLSGAQRRGTKEHDAKEAIRYAKQFHAAFAQFLRADVDVN